MKLKRFGLIAIVVLCFFSCFYYLNQKYDRFYRISGIDNEKRQMILNYLDEGEQEFLVEHSIATDRFMKYIQIEDFSLYLIAYYEVMEETDIAFLNTEHLIKYTNEMVSKIKSLTNKNVSNHYKQILKYNLDDLFLQSETYDLSLTRLYATYRNVFDTMNITDIDRINRLDEQMQLMDYTDSQKRSFLRKWQTKYSLEDLTLFLIEKQERIWIDLVEYPDSLTAIVDENTVVSSYIPQPLTIPYNVSRVSFGMYLRQDATSSLEELAKACAKDVSDETFLLVKAYQSYESLENNYQANLTGQRGGHDEFQLGLSIDVCVLNVAYDQFSQTQLCQYMKDNSWKYGYIQRYKDENEHVYRYVGKSAAKLIYEQQMTLEEYEGV